MIKASKKPSELGKAQELTINELTALYVQFNDKMKAAKADVDYYKALLVHYAKVNIGQFDGKLLTLPNGVKIENRSHFKGEFAKEKVTLEWLEQLIDEGFGEFVEVKFADKEIMANHSSRLDDLMELIDYCMDIKQVFAVKAA